MERIVQVEIIGLGELGYRKPDVIEAFATRDGLLTTATFPTRKEHEMLSHFSNYWSGVEKSEVPAIGVIKGTPHQFPVFVRGEQGTFAGGGLIRTAAAFKRLTQSGRPVVVRPWVDILCAGRRSNVRLELRVHVVAGCAVAVEYLFPPWASQRPTEKELQSGQAWMESRRVEAAQYAERIATVINCRWFVADFAETADGMRLIELNPGWCSGIASADAVRAVHSAILDKIFQIQTDEK
ncbi:MAG TPA: ATP-grasp domain-containing protein [Candidatus Sulfotelmatobacter sp.]|nr:ATP-grasp domain-containing protein [Candidatus Sulfotelmatobacter sp.]